MKYLLLGSLFVLFTSCAKSPYSNLQSSTANSQCLEKFTPDFSSVLYNTQVNVVGKHLSGLLFLKKMPDSTIRVIFSSEMGVKFFDFEYSEKGFIVVSCIKQLNKKTAIRQLNKVIGLIIMHGIDVSAAKIMRSETEAYYKFQSDKEEIYYITDQNCTHLLRIENASKRSKKNIVNLSDYKNGMADSIYIENQTFEFNINLKQLTR